MRLILDCDDEAGWTLLVSSLHTCLSDAGAPLNETQSSSLASVLRGSGFGSSDTCRLRPALDRARTEGEREDHRTFSPSVALEQLLVAATASERVVELLSVPSGAYRRSIDSRIRYLVAEFWSVART